MTRKKPAKISTFPKEGCTQCVKEMLAVGKNGMPKNNCGYCGARLMGEEHCVWRLIRQLTWQN